MEKPTLIDSTEALIDAAVRVIENWGDGDLAAAVRNLNAVRQVTEDAVSIAKTKAAERAARIERGIKLQPEDWNVKGGKHTPGEWKLDRNRVLIPVIDDQAGAEPHQFILQTNPGEAIANARLVSAAPDLLEALEEILADQETLAPAIRNEACLERARAAIQKARGE